MQDEVSFLVNSSCVSIQIRLNEDNWKYLGTFIVNLNNDPVRKQLINNKPRLYLTTGQNSYGVVNYRWWDGGLDSGRAGGQGWVWQVKTWP